MYFTAADVDAMLEEDMYSKFVSGRVDFIEFDRSGTTSKMLSRDEHTKECAFRVGGPEDG